MRRRWVYVDGEAIEVDQDYTSEPRPEYHVMPDIQPYRSMIDGSVITSRSRHREHLKAHGCVEVGNDSSLNRQKQPIKSPPGLKEKIIRATNQVLDSERRR